MVLDYQMDNIWKTLDETGYTYLGIRSERKKLMEIYQRIFATVKADINIEIEWKK